MQKLILALKMTETKPKSLQIDKI